MKYKIFTKKEKNVAQGGAYWNDTEFEEHLNLTYYQTSFTYLLNNYPPPNKILEAGCGIGRWVIPLSKSNYTVTGIEIEEKAIQIIKENYVSDNFEVVKGDIFNIPFEDNNFDIILSLGVLEHFEDPLLQKKAIYEHLRVLKNDGIFLVTVPHISILRLFIHIPYLFLLKIVRFLKLKKQYFSEYRYSKNEFIRILKECNLCIVDVIYDDLLPPYSFGLTVDYPVKRLFNSKDDVQYKLNTFGIFMAKILWKIHPKLISGGIGYICKKINI